MIESIYNFYKGFVTVKVISPQIERFLNMARNENIYIWNLKKLSPNEITFSVSVKGFKNLRKTVYKTSSKVKIINKKGAFRYLGRLNRRKFLVYSFIFSFILLMALNSLILDIEIVGAKTIDNKKILEKLSEINLKKFSLRSNIDIDRISLKLINDLDNISWVGVYEKGSKLKIEIKERKLPPQIVPKDVPCHIIARKDGIISSMNVENGEAAVKIGDVVTKGQVLVSGILPTKHDDMRYVHAMADITAKTWKEVFSDCKLYRYDKIYTGKKKSKLFLKLFGKEFDLSFGSIIPYYNSDINTKRNIFGFIEFKKDTYSEYTLKKVPISKEESLKKEKDLLYKELLKEYKKEQIQSVEFSEFIVDKETYTLRMIANLTEKIGESYIITKEE